MSSDRRPASRSWAREFPHPMVRKSMTDVEVAASSNEIR